MEAVGYDMYVKLLNEAVLEEQGEAPAPRVECGVDIRCDAYLSKSYIPAAPQRMEMYRKIARIEEYEDYEDILDELCDRFGEPPKAVMGLIDIALLRNRAAAIGIYEINEDKNGVILRVNAVCEQQLDRLNSFGKRMYLSADEKPYYFIKAKQGQKFTELISEIATIL